MDSDVQRVTSGPELQPGVRGWLILPAIGLGLSPLIGLVSLISAFTYIPVMQAYGYEGLYAVEILVDIVLLAFVSYVAFRFFCKRRDVPKLVTMLLYTRIAAAVFLLLIESAAGAQPFAVGSVRSVIQSGIVAAIWIPYFRVSKQVEVTFVE